MLDFNDRLAAEIPYLRRYALVLARDPDLADDLVQDCMERALLKRHLWLGRGLMRSWLYRMLHNVYVNGRRHPRRRYTSATVHESHGAMTQPARQDQRLECRDLAEALDKISAEQRETIVLVAFEGCAYEEAAAILGIPVGTVRSRLARGREALRVLTDSPVRSEWG